MEMFQMLRKTQESTGEWHIEVHWLIKITLLGSKLYIFFILIDQTTNRIEQWGQSFLSYLYGPLTDYFSLGEIYMKFLPIISLNYPANRRWEYSKLSGRFFLSIIEYQIPITNLQENL